MLICSVHTCNYKSFADLSVNLTCISSSLIFSLFLLLCCMTWSYIISRSSKESMDSAGLRLTELDRNWNKSVVKGQMDCCMLMRKNTWNNWFWWTKPLLKTHIYKATQTFMMAHCMLQNHSPSSMTIVTSWLSLPRLIVRMSATRAAYRLKIPLIRDCYTIQACHIIIR